MRNKSNNTLPQGYRSLKIQCNVFGCSRHKYSTCISYSCKKVNFETLKNKCQIEPIHCILYQYKVNHTHLNNLKITSSSSTILLNGCIRVSYSLHWYMHPDQFLVNVFHACFFMRHWCVQFHDQKCEIFIIFACINI